MSPRFATTTTIRRPRTALLWTVATLMVLLFAAETVFRSHFVEFRPFGALPLWVLGPLVAAIQRRPKIERAAIDASAEGLRIGDALVPRARLASALLRHEYDKAYVVLRGKGIRRASVDVQVENDEQADELCRALGLDAASTTAEFKLFRDDEAARKTALGAIAATAAIMAGATHAHLGPFAPLLLLALLFAVVVPVLILSRQVKLRVGADGIALRTGLTGKRFVSHDEIRSVRADGASIAIELEHGSPIRLSVASGKRRRRRRNDQTAEMERQAQSIVWRIEKAREAYRALAGDAPQAALALDRGEKSVREWIDQLRAIGAGANATFRSAQLTREQLLRIVESTTVAARERIAAAAALRDALSDDEKPRIRVAAERCAEPALGEAMVRVALAPSDEELESALEEASALSAVGESR